MMKSIMFCPNCRAYTLKAECGICSSRTVIPRPARYSPHDNYAAYRRKAKEPLLMEKGWL